MASSPEIPSRDRVEPGSHNIPLGQFPATCTTTPSDPDSIAKTVITQLNNALTKPSEPNALKSLFIENSYWRDHLVLSWDFRTLKGPASISSYIQSGSASVVFEIDRSSPLRAPHNGPIDALGEVHGIEFFVKVTTELGTGNGVVRLAQEGEEWKLFTIFTSLVELQGKKEGLGFHRPAGVQHGEQQGRKNWEDRRKAASAYEGGIQPSVLIVGMYEPANHR